jgi:hypothetical protein
MNSKFSLRRSDFSSAPHHHLFSISPGEPSQRVRTESPLCRTRLWRALGCSMAGLLIILVAAVTVAVTPSSAAQLAVSIRIGPPPLPVYAQPVCPGPGYIWTPGYWAYDPVNGYYWVPGTWVVAPAQGLLWTPGYWGWSGGFFLWHAGYWGPHVGFYGGINYGFGYIGVGYAGGYWRGGTFFYNRTVNNINVVNVRNVYSRTVVNNTAVTRVSYNGGPGGLSARPTAAEMAAEHDRHIEATRVQQQHQDFARQNRAQFASVNHGRPNVVATARPGEFQRSSAIRGGGGQKFTPQSPNRTPQGAPHNNLSRAQRPNPAGVGSHPSGTANAPSNRNAERSQSRSFNKQSQAPHPQASRPATANRNTGGPHQGGQELKANPHEGRKE